MTIPEMLRSVFDRTLDRCDPAVLTEAAVRRFPSEESVDVISLGKCAAAMLDGATRVLKIRRSFVCVPEGYPVPAVSSETCIGSHPGMSARSFEAGDALLRFLDHDHPTVFLISGGSSACIESPLTPWFTPSELSEVNGVMVRSGIPIEEINAVRKHLSAIKGGRLMEVATHSMTFVLSDVARGALHLVGSGPTLADPTTLAEAAAILRKLPGDVARSLASRLESGDVPETSKTGPVATLIADHSTLVEAAAIEVGAAGFRPVLMDGELNAGVGNVAEILAARGRSLSPGEVLIAGGEPTVEVRGGGRGGRCTEVASRFAIEAIERGYSDVCGLFASSDGVDGNSGTAGAVVYSTGSRGNAAMVDEIRRALDKSDSISVIEKVGTPILIPATGNNLRDLFLVSRDLTGGSARN